MEQPSKRDELERKFGENPRRYFAALANEYRRNGEAEQAIELCRRHLSEQRSHLSGHVVLGQALVEAGRPGEAWGVLRRALDLDPENFIALRLLGDLSVRSGEPEEAREYFRRALEIEPRNEQLLAAAAALEAGDSHSGETAAIQPEPQTIEPEPVVTESEAAVVAETTDGSVPDSGLMLSHEFAAPAREPEPESPPASEADFAAPDVVAADPAAASRLEEQPEEQFAPEPEPAEAPEPPRAALVSETMADLYLEQGHRAAAMDVLRELLTQRPTDERLRGRLAQLEREEQQPRVTVRDLFARLGARTQPVASRAADELSALFADMPAAARDAGADPLLAAVAPVRPADGAQELADWISELGEP